MAPPSVQDDDRRFLIIERDPEGRPFRTVIRTCREIIYDRGIHTDRDWTSVVLSLADDEIHGRLGWYRRDDLEVIQI